MAKRAHSEFRNLKNNKFVVELHRAAYTGDSHEFTIAADGLRIQYDANTEDLHDEIVSSAVTLTIVVKSTADEDMLDDLREHGEAGHRLFVSRDYTAGSTQYPLWHGVILDEIRVVDSSPRMVELNFTDDLGLLEEILYKDSPSAEYSDQQNLPVMLTRCLSKLRWFDEVYTTGKTCLKVQEYVTHDDVGGSPAADYIICNHQRLRNPNDDGEFEYFTAAEVLRLVLRIMQSRICLAAGVFWVRPPALMDESLPVYDNYLSNGTKDTDPDFADNVEFDYTVGNSWQTYAAGTAVPDNKLSGFEFGSLPPLSSVEILHKYDGLKYDWWGPTGIDQGSNWFDVNAYGEDTTTAVGEVVTLTFAYTYTIDGDLATNEGARAKISFRLRHGSRYATRPGIIAQNSSGQNLSSTYTTTGGNYSCFDVQESAAGYSNNSAVTIDVWLPVYHKAAGVEYGNGVESITFPPLDLSTGVTMIQEPSITLYNDDGTTYSEGATVGFPYIYQMHGAAVAEGDAIRYRRTNPDTTAREALDLGELLLGDRVSDLGSPVTLNWAINPAGPYVASTPDWNNAKFPSASQPIASLLCWDRMAMRLDTVKTITGSVRNPFVSPHKALAFDGMAFQLSSCSYNADFDFWDVEGILIDYDTATTPTNDETTPATFGTVGAFAGRLGLVTTGQFTGLVDRVSQISREQHDMSQTQADTIDEEAAKLAALQLDDLSDVSVPAPTTGHFLKWDGTSWRSAAASGGGASSLPDLDDVNSSLAPAAGDLLVWTTVNGGQWSSNTVPVAIGSQIDAGDLGNVTETATGTSGHILLDYALGGSAYWISTALDTATKSHVDLADIKNVDTATPSDGDLLQWDNAASKWKPYTQPAAFSFHILSSSFYAADGNGDYIPVGGTLSETTSSNYYTIWTAPLDGEVVKATCIVQATTAGSTQLRIRKYPVPTWIDTDTQTFSSAYTTGTFTFTTATFSAGDRLQFWFDPTGRPNGVQLSILIKLTHP